MNFADKFDSTLRENVKNIFQNHFNAIEQIEDIFRYEELKLSKSIHQPNIDILKAYQKLYKRKRIAQLLINLYNKFDLYADVKIGLKTGRGKSNILSKVYDSTRKPEENDVIEAIYQYVFCYLFIQCEEKGLCTEQVGMEYPVSEEPVTRLKRDNDCTKIAKNNHRKKSSVRLNKTECMNRWKCHSCNIWNINDRLSCIKCHKPQSHVWTCIKCTAHNEGPSAICFVCSFNNNNYLDRSWICWYRLCHEINDGKKEYCLYCGLDQNADRINVTTVKRKLREKINLIWICDKCDTINENCTSFICNDCGIARFFMRNEILDPNYHEIEDDENQNDVFDKHWRCTNCDCLNEDKNFSCTICTKPKLWTCNNCFIENRLYNSLCIVCDNKSDLCKKCRIREEVFDQLCATCLSSSSQWKCWYKLCRKTNYGNNKFCQFCGLERVRNKTPGAPVWQRDECDNVTIQRWICEKCYHINNKWDRNCVKTKCLSERIMHFIWCRNCGHSNPYGWYNLKCAACTQIL